MNEHVRPEPEREPLTIWVIYDHPIDFPSNYVARKHLNERPTSELMIAPDIEQIRWVLQLRGFICFPRQEGDDPKIVECWL